MPITIALIGAHGTGKTTVFDLLKTKQPDWQFFSESLRHILPAIGYPHPYKVVEEIGSGAFQLIVLNAWSVIDPQSNQKLDPHQPAVTDNAVISNYIYYRALRRKQMDFDLENIIDKMLNYYASLIDHFIYFPIGVVPLTADTMRPADIDFQKKIDDQIPKAFDFLKIPDNKIHRLQGKNPETRVKEIIQLINKK